MRQDTPGANPQGKTPFEKDLYFYHPDHLGSSSFVTDLNGKLYEHLEYFPFGEGWIEENTNVQRTPYLFTAKELDEETGLYYFGARYYDPRTSVWQSPDPIVGYLLATSEEYTRLPKKLALYSYALQQPLVHVDPDGRDALIVAFTEYKVGTPLGRLPYLGHAGIVLIDNKTGATRYYEYGRYDAAQKGIVVRRTVPDVVMGEKGSPTQESMARLLKAVSEKGGKGSAIEGAYIKNDNYKQMVDKAEARKSENDDPNRKPYGNVQNNCYSFACEIAESGGASTPLSIIDWPNQSIGDLQRQNPSVRFDPQKGEVGGLLYDKPKGIREHIKAWIDKALE
jgi:RHS repeat-associated protein